MATSGVKHDFDRLGLIEAKVIICRPLVDVPQFVFAWCRVHFRDDKIGVICILHHIIAIGDWSQISGMDCIRCWAYGRTLDDACKDVEEIGELAMEFSAVVNAWNSLPDVVSLSPTVPSFQHKLQSFLIHLIFLLYVFFICSNCSTISIYVLRDEINYFLFLFWLHVQYN